jgi:UDP-N-acetylmuramoyl-L-alanyl-D-glutamate--2,6-diaminopimelate ligase
MDVWTPLIGAFNAYNLLAAYAAAQLLGVDKDEALRLLSAIPPVAGRFETLRGAGNVTVIVDYAHTPDALQNVLRTINDIRRDEQLITVVGCGGNRDTAKRPVMAQIAADHSDRVVFTSDNPRDEDPEAILRDMKAGLDAAQRAQSLFITDRREAIRTALMLAQSAGAIVLLAGKGHEKYQEINGRRTAFDDREVASEMLKEPAAQGKNTIELNTL